MVKLIAMPRLGMKMTEGRVIEWRVQPGDWVKEGQVVLLIESDKAEVEVEAQYAGVVRHIYVEPDQKVACGTALAALTDSVDEAFDPTAQQGLPSQGVTRAQPPSDEPSPVQAAAHPSASRAAPATPAARRRARELDFELAGISGTGPAGRVTIEDVEAAAAATETRSGVPTRASPAAKRMAHEHNIDLSTVVATGPGGRIVKADVEAARSAAEPALTPVMATPSALSGEIPYRGIRRTVGQRMSESIHGMAQLTLTMEADVTDAVKLRADLLRAWDEPGVRVTYTDIVLKAAARALREHPRANAMLEGDAVRIQPEVHVGFAVALDEGLVVPVIRHADAKPLKQIAVESLELTGRARERRLAPDDMADGTFTVTSLGMYDVDLFTPIINPPQAAILGVGRIVDRPAFVGDSGSQIERRSYLSLNLTIDHRVLDGVPGALYLQSVRHYLEHPYLLLTEI
jgi:pyruvate dehydrogenase E2 component (dihydrolipoamide acetyltransferase)